MADSSAKVSQPADGPSHAEPIMLGRLELARALCVSASTVDRMDAAGELPAAVKLRGRKVWRREAIEEWSRLGCPG
ncbi:MAG: helix-turn-helix transcriptional regulator, partial [Planctomycetia bacterium]